MLLSCLVLFITLGTPSQPINYRHQARGTPGMTLHSALYPTPHKISRQTQDHIKENDVTV